MVITYFIKVNRYRAQYLSKWIFLKYAYHNVFFILFRLFYQPMLRFNFLFRGIIATGVSEIFVVRNVSFYIDMKEHICGVCYECD